MRIIRVRIESRPTYANPSPCRRALHRAFAPGALSGTRHRPGRAAAVRDGRTVRGGRPVQRPRRPARRLGLGRLPRTRGAGGLGAPSEPWLLMFAVVDGVPGDPDDHHKSRRHLSRSEGALLIGEITAGAGPIAQLSVGHWRYTEEFAGVRPVREHGAFWFERDNHGTYVTAEFRPPTEFEPGRSGLPVTAEPAWHRPRALRAQHGTDLSRSARRARRAVTRRAVRGESGRGAAHPERLGGRRAAGTVREPVRPGFRPSMP